MKQIDKRAFTIAEITVATAVLILMFASLMLVNTSSRAETSQSINYLRALQLAQEAIDWINSAPFSEVTESRISFLEGSLVDPSSGNSIKMPVGENAKNSIDSPQYPDDYSKCYFYRTIQIEDLKDEVPNGRFLKKVTVGIYWNEGKVPKKIESTSNEPDRMRKLMLSTIIFNEKEYY